jgi:hypothetical protein
VWALLALATGAAAVSALTSISAPAGAQQPPLTSTAARCPLKPSAAFPGGEAWAFTATGVPASAHSGTTATYAHGRGTWTHGHGAGTICRADAPAGGPVRDVVLRVGGRARLAPGVTQLGRRGVSLTLSVTVAASDFAACAAGTRGTVTIFASYFEGHHDRVQLRFGDACTAENATFLGPQLRALVARDGRQVNHA